MDSRGRVRLMAAVLFLQLLFCVAALGQEALRMSLAGAEAARARREAAARTDLFNLHLGPTWWAFGTGLGVEYSDNLRGTYTNPEADFSFRPQIDALMRYRLSDVNTLNLSLGAGYAVYVEHDEYNRPFITPGSELSFDLYVGDFWINVHDRFSIEENGYLDPTATDIGDYQQLENAAGISTTWDLNRIILRLNYDHVTYISLGGSVRPDADSDVFSSSAAWMLRRGTLVGIEAGATMLRYSGFEEVNPWYRAYYTDGFQWNTGVFYESQVSDYIWARASVGYTVFTPSDDSGYDEASGVYAQLAVRHRVNKHLEYTLSGGRQLTYGYYTRQVDQYYAGIDARWNVIWKTKLRTSFYYQHGTLQGLDEIFYPEEEYDWLGPGISLERQITAHLTASLGYRYYWRDSNLPDRDYTANFINLRAMYKF